MAETQPLTPGTSQFTGELTQIIAISLSECNTGQRDIAWAWGGLGESQPGQIGRAQDGHSKWEGKHEQWWGAHGLC